MASPDNKWVSVAEACDLAGCTDGWIRHLLRAGRLGGFQVNEWTWMVDRSEANAAKQAKPSKPAPKRGSRKSA